MENTSITKMVSYLKKLILYQPPTTPSPFVLEEIESRETNKPSGAVVSANEINTLLRSARRLEATIEQAISTIKNNPSTDQLKTIQQQIKALENQNIELSPMLLAYSEEGELVEKSISASLEENILTIKKLFRLPHNKDILIREFGIPSKPPLKAILVFAQGLVDGKVITSTALAPLFTVQEENPLSGDILELLITKYLPSNQAVQVKDFRTVVKQITSGYTALFIDGASGAILLETKGFERRAVGRPAIEETVRGSQSAFTETLLTNISLLRLSVRSEDLVTEIISVGERSKTDCAVMYIDSVVNPVLVAEVKRRITSISTDSIAPGMMENFIVDHPLIPFPQVLATERPDRVSFHLSEGRVAILVDGDPFVMVAPISLFTLFHSPEDFALNALLGTFMRLTRFTAAIFTILIPAFYIAISYYHQEALPTDLILAIAGARERIPFPVIVEVLLMELSFEIVREAGTRVPGMLGETVGIVGGIILGQAVVAANLVSPVTVVVVAITAIASFAIPDFRIGMAVRLIRFMFMLMGATMGLVGVASFLYLLTGILAAMKSFGVPYLTPIAPKTIAGFDIAILGPVYRQEKRPDELNTLDRRRQASVSRKWTKQPPEEGDAKDEL